MFRRFHAMRMERDERGFTLIELLVVILIIAILAAIAIPVFLSQRTRGWRSQSQSALKNAATAMESCATDNNGSYADETASGGIDCGTAVDDNTYGFNATNNVTVAPASNGRTGYCLQAVHDLLTDAGDEWATSSYDSAIGEPQAGACTNTY